MNKRLKIFFIAILALITILSFTAFGCSGCIPEQESRYVVSIQNAGNNSDGQKSFLVTYNDGTTSTFTVKDGVDGDSVTIDEIYDKYCEEVANITFGEFLHIYFDNVTLPNDDYSKEVATALLSSLKIYAETYEGTSGNYSKSLAQGSGVVYKITDKYVYVITNYHVVFNKNATTAITAKQTAHKIVGYLYGSEGVPLTTNTVDKYACPIYNYGANGIDFTYVGGSIEYDLALIKANLSDVLSVNEDVKAVTICTEYNVGETAIAIGNTEGEGISVTQGVISVASEVVQFALDGTKRDYRCMRIDTAISHGNSGGGLFNNRGQLIGITNGGSVVQLDDGTEIGTAINYALLGKNVKAVIENIYYYENDSSNKTNGVYRPTIGLTVKIADSVYKYDETLGYGKIVHTVAVESTHTRFSPMTAGDVVTGIKLGDKKYSVEVMDDIGTILLYARFNDNLTIYYLNNGTEKSVTTTLYESMFSKIA